jgi:hypothetical protein
MDQELIVQHIAALPGVNLMEGNGDYFFIYDPERNLPPNRQMPFATLVNSNVNDEFSDLDRPGVYRLNIGVSRQTFESLLPDADAEYDFKQLDTLLPHPVYGRMHWLCVLNPSLETWQQLQLLLSEAYKIVVDRHARMPQAPTT